MIDPNRRVSIISKNQRVSKPIYLDSLKNSLYHFSSRRRLADSVTSSSHLKLRTYVCHSKRILKRKCRNGICNRHDFRLSIYATTSPSSASQQQKQQQQHHRQWQHQHQQQQILFDRNMQKVIHYKIRQILISLW